jgi:hypothetical protein
VVFSVKRLIRFPSPSAFCLSPFPPHFPPQGKSEGGGNDDAAAADAGDNDAAFNSLEAMITYFPE